ncbi:MAG: hypothetical protein JNL54_04195 [Kineosporiaceae bacterium]|nr:hypothetical protein [Kineosporiaceae bacterium]
MDEDSPPLDALAALVWQLSAGLRAEAHSASSGCRTRTAPYGPGDPSGTRIADACRDAGCLDIVHEILLVVRPRLVDRGHETSRLGALQDPLAYANGAVRRAVADLRRARRVQRGLPAKPSRSDGTAGLVEAALRERAASPQVAAWFEVLFRLMRSYPCRPGAPGRSWPLDAWCQEKSALDGGRRESGAPGVRQEIDADIRHVLAVVDEVAGAAWRFRNITEPLRRGGADAGPLPENELEHPHAGSLEDEALIRLFEHCYHRLRDDGAAQLEALRTAAGEVYGSDPQAPRRELLGLARDLDTRRPRPDQTPASRVSGRRLGAVPSRRT